MLKSDTEKVIGVIGNSTTTVYGSGTDNDVSQFHVNVTVTPVHVNYTPISIDGYGYISIALLVAICTAGAIYMLWWRKSTWERKHPYLVSVGFSIIALLAAIPLARYPLQISWLPLSLPNWARYPFQLVGWFLVVILFLRFVWTMSILLDRHGVFLAGDYKDLGPEIEERARIDAEVAELFDSVKLHLFDRDVVTFFKQVKTTSPSDKAYAFGWTGYLVLLEQHVPSFTHCYVTYALTADSLELAPKKYQPAIREALTIHDPVPYKEATVGEAQAVVYAHPQENVCILVAGRGLKPVLQDEVMEWIRHFDAAWANV
ncbi:hypothetical protein [Alicyclobacillus dauci]|uniref:Uncharacterized protein n=1 Tax=Alicyclobacillus dauci TaxID=1475485 RepID=A0ABY6Z4U6_9BACL|nr:hypothetical protein [Alicyclobacillus dauci]WAH37794.1 hypothetical protein NZD86_04625 [Alicyclobacillus dauci]